MTLPLAPAAAVAGPKKAAAKSVFADASARDELPVAAGALQTAGWGALPEQAEAASHARAPPPQKSAFPKRSILFGTSEGTFCKAGTKCILKPFSWLAGPPAPGLGVTVGSTCRKAGFAGRGRPSGVARALRVNRPHTSLGVVSHRQALRSAAARLDLREEATIPRRNRLQGA